MVESIAPWHFCLLRSWVFLRSIIFTDGDSAHIKDERKLHGERANNAHCLLVMCQKAASAGQVLKRQMAAQQNGASAHVEQPTSCAGMQKKTSSQMQGTVQNSQQTATDSSTHIQSCLSRPPDQVATLTLNYCCNFSQAEPVEVPHPSFCLPLFTLFLSSSCFKISRNICSFIIALSCCISASFALFIVSFSRSSSSNFSFGL